MTMHTTSRLRAENQETQEVAAFQAIDFIHQNAEVLWKILQASRLKSTTDAVDNLVI